MCVLKILKEDQKNEMLKLGLLFPGPNGRLETADERDRRLAHNSRMRFNRSFESALENEHSTVYI